MRCPKCGAENPAGKGFCGDCGASLSLPPSDSEEILAPPRPGSDRPRIGRRTTWTALVVAIVLIVIGAAVAYYYQPVRGSLWPQSTTIVKGQSVSFDFTPKGGVAPYHYYWSFGDGASSTAKAPSHIYDTIGTWHVSLTVTDTSGVKGHFIATVTVRLPLVFIDTVSYPSYLSSTMGNTEVDLYIDGTQVGAGATISPGTSHTIGLKIVWVLDFGIGLVNRQIMVDETGTITAPSTQTDLHCSLSYNPLHNQAAGIPTFTLVAT